MRIRYLLLSLALWGVLLLGLYAMKFWIVLGVAMGLPVGCALAILLFAMEISANRTTWGYGPSARYSSGPGSSS